MNIGNSTLKGALYGSIAGGVIGGALEITTNKDASFGDYVKASVAGELVGAGLGAGAGYLGRNSKLLQGLGHDGIGIK